MIRLLSGHHPAANPSLHLALCQAAGQRGRSGERGGEVLAEAQLPHVFQDGVSPFVPELTAPDPAFDVSGQIFVCHIFVFYFFVCRFSSRTLVTHFFVLHLFRAAFFRLGFFSFTHFFVWFTFHPCIFSSSYFFIQLGSDRVRLDFARGSTIETGHNARVVTRSSAVLFGFVRDL